MTSKDYNIITIVRSRHLSTGAVFGRLFINDESFCDTLEYDKVMIPFGCFDLSLTTKSPAFQNHEPYKSLFNGCVPRLLNVSGRSGILFHIGNFTKDTHGCILVGKYYPFDKYGNNRLQESRSTFIAFFNKLLKFKYPIKVNICSLENKFF